MPNDNNATIQRALKIREETTRRMFLHDMLADNELLRVDTMVQSMRHFVANKNQTPDKKFDDELTAFIISYLGSGISIYGGADSEPILDKITKDIRDNLKVSIDISSLNALENISEAVPMVKSIKQKLLDIASCKENMEGMGSVKRINDSAKIEANVEKILIAAQERIKEKHKGAKVVRFIPGTDVNVEIMLKGSKTRIGIGSKVFDTLNTEEGFNLLNEALAEQNQKTASKASVKADNEKIKENKNALEEHIAKEEKKIKQLLSELEKTVKNHIQNLSGKKLLAAFAPKPNADNELENILKTCTNHDELKTMLVKSFENEKKIWDYVQDAKYYDLIKNSVRAGYDKNSDLYKAMSDTTKNLFEVREIELNGLKTPSKQSLQEMNEALQKHGFKIRLQKISVSAKEKPAEYQVKPSTKIADIILKKATAKEGECQLSPYTRRYMTLGLVYALGEGKDDNAVLFKKYMQIYFDKKDMAPVEIPSLMEKYGWESFKKNNSEIAKEVYTEIKNNAEDASRIKENLLNVYSERTVSASVHHNIPRRLGEFFSNPDDLNNQPNLAVTIQWKGWEKDNHQLEHFFNLSQHDGVLSNLTMENGEYIRKDDSKGIKDVYYEKPQIKKDGKWADLIPEDTLLVTPNKTISAPKLLESVKHLSLGCFKPLEIDNSPNNSPIFNSLNQIAAKR